MGCKGFLASNNNSSLWLALLLRLLVLWLIHDRCTGLSSGGDRARSSLVNIFAKAEKKLTCGR